MEFLWGDTMGKDRGVVLRIERASIHDGPGLRTVVFLKGCPLRCKWCSTPESQSFHIEMGYGKEMTVEEVMEEVVKDEVFFFHSGGGVTLSGGEALAQPEFAREILKRSKGLGINTGIETSLYSKYEIIEDILPWLDFIYMDIKHMDSKDHKEWVGIGNTTILENIKKVDDSKYPLKIYIRIPIIPGINDNEYNLTATASFCRDLKRVDRIELLPYHRLGIGTYEKLGREYELKDLASPSREYIVEKVNFMSQLLSHIEVKAGGGY